MGKFRVKILFAALMCLPVLFFTGAIPVQRYIIPVSVTLMVNGTRHTFNAKNISGANYFRYEDLSYAFDGSIIHGTQLGRVLRTAEGLSSYSSDGHMYFSIRQVADILNFRVTWVGSRNTIIVDASDTIATEIVFTAEPLPDYIIGQITGSSFHNTAPFGHDHLSYLTITHVDFDGNIRHGNMIVAASIAEEVLDIFREIYEGGFPIARMRLIDYYAADDYYSMADNNSVGFNFRYIAGTRTLSRHAFGMAIDINPVQNPFIRGNTILPAAGSRYLDRADVRPGMITPGDVVYNAFTSRGWTWGGHWRVPIDYHHFEKR